MWGRKEAGMKTILPRPFLEADGGTGGGESTKATFDELMKDKEYQSEFDKRINKAMETNSANWQKKMDDEIARIKDLYNDQLTEKDKLAKMNADEKAKYEQEKKEAEWAKREADLTKRELKAEALSQLGEAGIKPTFANFIDYTSADTVKSSIDSLKTLIEAERKEADEFARNDVLKGSTPPPKSAETNGDDGEDDPFDAKLNKYRKG